MAVARAAFRIRMLVSASRSAYLVSVRIRVRVRARVRVSASRSAYLKSDATLDVTLKPSVRTRMRRSPKAVV